ncbi:hypothetical protein J27TS7_30270 [Paenibacillus dendritiformis]|nr:hypothetical protein J27TS7_30270 [Paenibacillus dendritiformis]
MINPIPTIVTNMFIIKMTNGPLYFRLASDISLVLLCSLVCPSVDWQPGLTLGHRTPQG